MLIDARSARTRRSPRYARASRRRPAADCGWRRLRGRGARPHRRVLPPALPAGEDLLALLERHGKLPLPPYIQRAAGEADESRYQTVYAREPGSVAAPTAGLHFDDALLARIAERGAKCAWLTLHVGAGTFQPVRVDDLGEHRMHRERYVIPQETVDAIAATRAAGGRVIAVGTTSMRASRRQHRTARSRPAAARPRSSSSPASASRSSMP